MKRLKYIFLGAISYVVVAFLLTSYGNASSHLEINQLIIQKFNEVFLNTLSPGEKYKNTLFVSTAGVTFPGTYIEQGGLFPKNLIEEQRELNPWAWISHGGFSADEPEIFASFRHFYDPTEREGNRYLHDHLDELDRKGIIDNPQIDHLKWALDHSEHQYNWKNGKTAIISALQSEDKDFRDEEMAFAWRALGETLHMIADMGCPAHVRDDAHAAETFTGYQLGSPDPYEEIFEEISRAEGVKEIFNAGKTDPELKTVFRKATTLEEIAHELAVYTNSNFFTHQTITGKDNPPIIHPEKTYKSPTLEQCEYIDEEYTYYKQISGNNVKMCRDIKYTMLGFKKSRGTPFIDKECTYSQAQAILPQIVEAGINVMNLFIPEMKVEIEKIDIEKNELKVKVIHKTNDEYPREINYNGKVTIYDAKTLKKIIDVDCVDGVVEAEFKKTNFAKVKWEDYGVYAEIEYGGLFVKSEPYLLNDNQDYVAYLMSVTLWLNGIYERNWSSEAKAKDKYKKDEKSNFEGRKTYFYYRGELQRSGYILYHDFKGESIWCGNSDSEPIFKLHELTHVGRLSITLKNNEIERVEFKDFIVGDNDLYHGEYIINYKSKSFPLENAHFEEYDDYDDCNGGETVIITHQWDNVWDNKGGEKNITESFNYSMLEQNLDGGEIWKEEKREVTSYKTEQEMYISLYIGGANWLCEEWWNY